MSRDHHMYVFRTNGAGVDDDFGALNVLSESARDGASLQTGEVNRLTRQVFFRFESAPNVMWISRQRASLLCSSRGTTSEKYLPRADEVGPRSARIVR